MYELTLLTLGRVSLAERLVLFFTPADRAARGAVLLGPVSSTSESEDSTEDLEEVESDLE